MNETAKGAKTENKLWTPVFRVSYPNVFQPRAVMQGQTPKYSIAMLFPKVYTDPTEAALFEKLKTAVTAAAVSKWGPDKTKWPKNLRSPWHDGSEKDSDGYGPDIIYASASSSKIKPGVVDAQMNDIIEPNEFYGGCYARATITVFAYENVTKGVAFGLRNIQKVRDGEPFTSMSKPQDDFDAIPAPGASKAEPVAAAAPAGDPLGI